MFVGLHWNRFAKQNLGRFYSFHHPFSLFDKWFQSKSENLCRRLDILGKHGGESVLRIRICMDPLILRSRLLIRINVKQDPKFRSCGSSKWIRGSSTWRRNIKFNSCGGSKLSSPLTNGGFEAHDGAVDVLLASSCRFSSFRWGADSTSASKWKVVSVFGSKKSDLDPHQSEQPEVAACRY